MLVIYQESCHNTFIQSRSAVLMWNLFDPVNL